MQSGHSPELIFAGGQRYDCLQCGKCCRCFHIAITALEVEAVARLQWPSGQTPTRDFYVVHGGRSFIRHQANGDCIYLDSRTQCRMHRAFGAHCKPLACKAYPFEFLATFDGQVSVMARFDCPAVLAGHGRRLSAHHDDISHVLSDRQLRLGAGFTAGQLRGLNRDAVEGVCGFIRMEIERREVSMAALQTLAERLEKLGANFLNDQETLQLVLPSMRDKAQFEQAMASRPSWSWPQRVTQRGILLEYLRRDESLPDFSAGTRLRQAWAGMRFFAGGGNAHDLCASEHPDFAVRQARLFDEQYWSSPDEADADDAYRRFLSARLETLQFFGAANHGCAFFDGLRELLACALPARLLARLHAASSGRRHLASPDWAYATSAVDHCFGRRLRG